MRIWAWLKNELQLWRWAIRIRRAAKWRSACSYEQRQKFDSVLRRNMTGDGFIDFTDAIYHAMPEDIRRAVATTDAVSAHPALQSIYRNRSAHIWADLGTLPEAPPELENLIIDAMMDFGPNGTMRGAEIIAAVAYDWCRKRSGQSA
jgi:hypothetical protein